MKNCYIALVHHPVVNKRGEIVTTSVTNLDIHDIARSARTFGFAGYYIVTPAQKQQALIQSILDHWNTDYGNEYNPDRKDALSFINVANTLEDVYQEVEARHGAKSFKVATAAGFKEFDGTCGELRQKLSVDNRPMVLIFGTGWGLHASVTENVDFRLEPIFGAAKDGYNHLSVRSAVAIYCDRLRGSL